jgi:hypothetical protein
MALRYSDTPQLRYGKQEAPNANWRERFPENAQPIATAPENGASPTWIFENNGDAYRSCFHRGQWQKLAPQRDDHTGAIHWRMTGEAVAHPVAWLPGHLEPPR